MAILIIDDSEETRLDIAAKLAGLAYCDSLSFASLPAALELIEERAAAGTPLNVELILLSTTSENWSSLREVRTVHNLKDTPVIVLAEPTPAAQKFAFSLGAADFVAKPVDKFQLLIRVRNGLRWRLEIERRMAREKELMATLHALSESASGPLRQSTLDTLTGALNIEAFERCIEREWRRAARNRSPMSVVLVKLKGETSFGQTYGLKLRDKALQSVASVIGDALNRPGDAVARSLDRGFIIVLPETPSAGAALVADRIRSQVEGLRLSDQELEVGPALSIETEVLAMTPHRQGSFSEFLKVIETTWRPEPELDRGIDSVDAVIKRAG